MTRGRTSKKEKNRRTGGLVLENVLVEILFQIQRKIYPSKYQVEHVMIDVVDVLVFI